MTSKTILTIGVALVLALGACTGSEPEQAAEIAAEAAAEAAEAAAEATEAAAAVETAATPTWVAEMAAIANAVERQPAAADSLLQAAAMTREKFDSLLYVIAANAELSAQFEALRTK